MIENSGAPEDALNAFRHTLAADDVWIQRIHHGGQPPFTEPADLESAKILITKLTREWNELLDSLSEDELERVVSYRNIKGMPFDMKVGDILMHVFNHGTYHRGQIARAVRLSGGEPLPTDMSVFYRDE